MLAGTGYKVVTYCAETHLTITAMFGSIENK